MSFLLLRKEKVFSLPLPSTPIHGLQVTSQCLLMVSLPCIQTWDQLDRAQTSLLWVKDSTTISESSEDASSELRTITSSLKLKSSITIILFASLHLMHSTFQKVHLNRFPFHSVLPSKKISTTHGHRVVRSIECTDNQEFTKPRQEKLKLEDLVKYLLQQKKTNHSSYVSKIEIKFCFLNILLIIILHYIAAPPPTGEQFE